MFLFYLPLVVGYCAAALTACRRSSANLVCQACQALFFHQSLGLVILQQQLQISPSSLSKIHAATRVPQPSKPTLLARLLDKKLMDCCKAGSGCGVFPPPEGSTRPPHMTGGG